MVTPKQSINKEAYTAKNIIAAMRLAFVSVGILPFVAGSLAYRHKFDVPGFVFGLVCVASMQVSSNLINDYADSKSGVDWQDKFSYLFFGGSKFIQRKIFPERFYVVLSLVFAAVSLLAAATLAAAMKNYSVILFFCAVLALGWGYSLPPLKFCYRRLGEAAIFVLCGPVSLMGGYFIQARAFPDIKSFVLSLPFGFFTTAILFANEIPDFKDDLACSKHNWVGFLGPSRSFILYLVLVALGFLSIALAVSLGYLNKFALLSFLLVLLAVKAASILKEFWEQKGRLVVSSKLTIALQTITGLILIMAAL